MFHRKLHMQVILFTVFYPFLSLVNFKQQFLLDFTHHILYEFVIVCGYKYI